MRPIQMVDLKQQYQKIKPELDQAIQEVLDSTSFIKGPQVQEFSLGLAKFIGARHAIPCANGTDALQITLMALGLAPGDEVITPSFTFIATVEVVGLLHLTPVFVDVDPQTYCLDATQLKKAISKKTKAIIPVHLYGQSADMEPILEIARDHSIPVIEDNAQSIGSDYRFSNGNLMKTGAMGLASSLSFFPSKNLGAYGDAGAICTNDDEMAQKCRMIADHGQSSRYYYDRVGCNSRMDSIQAAILNVKLGHLEEYISSRIRVADYYDKAFRKVNAITIPHRSQRSKHVFHQYTIQVPKGSRDALQKHLGALQIPSAIYYPVPAHRQKMFESFNSSSVSLPITEQISERVLSLPIHTEMDVDQQNFIISTVTEFFD